MKIIELEWLKQNKHQLDEEDYKAIEKLSAFSFIEKGEINCSVSELIETLDELSRIVGKYHEVETTSNILD